MWWSFPRIIRNVAVEGDGVKIQVEGAAVPQPLPAHRVQPVAHQPGVAGRGDAAAVLAEEGALGDDVQPGKEGQPLVQHVAHHVGMPGVAEELEGQQGPHRAGGGDLLGAGELAAGQDAVQVAGGQVGQEEEQAAKAGADVAGREVQLPHVGGRRGLGAGLVGAVFVAAAREAGESLLVEEVGDGGGAERVPLMLQGPADVIDREVLLAQGDDALATLLGARPARGAVGDEERAAGVLAEAVDQDAEAAGAVAESSGGLLGGQALDEEGAEGLVLAVRGVGGLKEPAAERYLIA